MIVVELIASMPPRKRLSILPQPNMWPTDEPSMLMAEMMVTAAMTGPAPILTIFLKLNSMPSVNIRNITPMSAQVCMSAASVTVGVILR